jgi:hypothetical protein
MMTTHSEKSVDAVEMKRRAARRIHDRLKGASRSERLAYWQERTEALRKRQDQAKTPESDSG